MRKVAITLLLMTFLAVSPAGAEDRSPGREFGLAGAAAAFNLLYTPPKLVMALVGLPLGAITGVCTGWNVRSMYAVWVPTVTGTYFLTPAHLERKRPIEFFGSHYPTTLGCAANPKIPCGHHAHPKAPEHAP